MAEGITTSDQRPSSRNLPPGGALVIDLLTYIEQVEKLNNKPAFSVPTEIFVAFQHELKGLPEVQFNLQEGGDDIWLCIPRLQETQPPDVGDSLRLWVNLPKLLAKLPELKAERVVMNGRNEVARERLEDHPDLTPLLAWYIENQWIPWVSAEGPRRKTMERYNALFSLQQTMSTGGTETPLELVWGLGQSVWRKPSAKGIVKHPLITQACEVTLDERSGALEVRPRDAEPRLEADCYSALEVSGLTQIEALWKSTQAAQSTRINPFEASTFEGVLKAAVNNLDPMGSYRILTDDVRPPEPGEHLQVTNTWVLFARKRSANILLEDIRRLKKSVADATSLPPVIRSFVEAGADAVRVQPEQPFRGLSSSDSPLGAFELYFPMPYNDEQVSIVQKLENNDGVVVQGPPGTGKTHTIANVVCHYLAQGKRVLVTAKGEPALAVLQEKLPEGIRALSVALLSDEKGGKQQFEHAIQTISRTVSNLIPHREEGLIAVDEAKLNALHAKIAAVDRTVAQYAAKHMQHYSFQGQEVTPEGMARMVLAEADAHTWFVDSPPVHGDDGLPFGDGDIGALRQARIKVGARLEYLKDKLPSPDLFPSWVDLLALHRDIVRAKQIEARVNDGDILPLVDATFETFEKADELATFLSERTTLETRLSVHALPWISKLKKRLAASVDDDPLLAALNAVCDDLGTLEQQRRALAARAIEVPADAEQNEDFQEAVKRLVAGLRPFVLPFGKADARQLIGAVRVVGSAPADTAGWWAVSEVVQWREAARRAMARWAAVAPDYGLDCPIGGLEQVFRTLAEWQQVVKDVQKFVFDFEDHLANHVADVFGARTADDLRVEHIFTLVTTSVRAHLDRGRLGYALKRVADLRQKLTGCSGAVVEELDEFFIAGLGVADNNEDELAEEWRDLVAELTRVTDLRSCFATIREMAKVIEAAGAPLWATRLRHEVAGNSTDPAVPGTWLEAWNWRLACVFLEKIDGHDALRKLFEERKALTTTLSRTYQDLVARKTWVGVHRKATDLVRSALQTFQNAIEKMGSGTGVRAVRYRSIAREAMLTAYKAVPCWVLPTWRVSETIPPDVGLFDLVIIDEASQSDIWALPALLRGKKLLVVGDHKQVSPSAVGTAETRIVDLMQRYLKDQPHRSEMTPDKSIYDLARVVFAGNSVMLREHFRCVPAIIEFSNREFYQGDIQPLRLPKANERLDPPLVDVFVKGGYRKGDTNPAEAEAIVQEIESVVADPRFDGRTLGIVTLLGTEQAAKIHELINVRIPPDVIVKRQIAVGPPPVFQGRERDIMFVSMVLGPGSRAAATKADIEQRFNVALSRARDRMYLFRSVGPSEFREDTLNGKLMRHFRQPFTQDRQQVTVLRDRCESGFETEVFDELAKRGYRVQPQVACAGFRIDFVVEGREGRRLAVECDGDRFHGPGQWSDDMARQRVLERAGWVFWRVFASTFARRREAMMADLVETLTRHCIEPIGHEPGDSSVWVQYKEVDPFDTEALLEDDQAEAA